MTDSSKENCRSKVISGIFREYLFGLSEVSRGLEFLHLVITSSN